jgi:hypothetical protein
MDGSCSTNGSEEKFIISFPEKREGKRPLGRSIRRWVGNNKMDIREIGYEAVDGFIWLRIEPSGGLLRTR